MRLSVLAALSENRVIGNQGRLPWRLPDEMRRVKQLSMGHCLLMGRKTFESIGRSLPGRTTIVITRNPDFAHKDVVVARDLDAAITTAEKRGDDEAFVFGGETIYQLALPQADRLYLTRIHAEFEGDAFFPDFDEREWALVSETRHPADENHTYAFTFQWYERRRTD